MQKRVNGYEMLHKTKKSGKEWAEKCDWSVVAKKTQLQLLQTFGFEDLSMSRVLKGP